MSLMLAEKSTRRLRSLDEARDFITAWRGSGATKEVWCREQGLACSTLNACLAQIRRYEVAAVDMPALGFIAVHPPRSVVLGAGELRIELGGGARVMGLGLVDVVAILRGLRDGDA